VKRTLAVTVLLLASGLLAVGCDEAPVVRSPGSGGSAAGGAASGGLPRVLVGGLSGPWQLTWGPDNFLWVTEQTGKRITRINPDGGSSSDVVDLPDAYSTGAEDGLLGMAFGLGALYVAYDYNAAASPAVDLRGKIVRYRYDQSAASLTNPVEVLTGLPASTSNTGGRLAFGPDQKLYLTVGDQGNNAYDRACLPIRSQDLPTAPQVSARDWGSYAGKVLRLNPDGGIPSDNPLIRGVRSHIFSYGHRNPEGLAFGANGQLYSTEQGPKTDDEINLLRGGRNYGWPFVAGYRDDQAYRYANWSAARGCAQLGYNDADIPAAVPRGPAETAWNSPDYVEPLKTLYTVPNGYNFADSACAPDFDRCWPSVAPSSLAYLPADTPDPALANSLLVPSLRNGSVYALKLSQDGNSVQGDALRLFRTHNRYRDIAVSPDHTRIYLATDNTGQGGARPDEQTGPLDNPGCILEFALTAPLDSPRPLTGPSPTPNAPAPQLSPTTTAPTTAPTSTTAPPSSRSAPPTGTFAPRGSSPRSPAPSVPAAPGTGNPLLPPLTPSGPSDDPSFSTPPSQ